jgi:hypothetical protein
VKDRRPITEDDILLTEMLIAKSYGNLKQSVVRASSDAFGTLGESVGGTIKKHPYATAGAAVGAGVLLVMLFKLMGRGGSGKRKEDGGRGRSSDMGADILSMLMPLAMPYITAYLEKYLGSMVSGKRGRA